MNKHVGNESTIGFSHIKHPKEKKGNIFFFFFLKQLVICLHNSLGSKKEEKGWKTVYNKK